MPVELKIRRSFLSTSPTNSILTPNEHHLATHRRITPNEHHRHHRRITPNEHHLATHRRITSASACAIAIYPGSIRLSGRVLDPRNCDGMTTPPLDRPPLWRLMADAYDQSSVPTHLIEAADPETGNCLTDRYGYAAEIRALQRHILPDEPALSEEESRDPIILSTYRQRHRLRELLLEEADRAEESR
jgi:hypothetical protein